MTLTPTTGGEGGGRNFPLMYQGRMGEAEPPTGYDLVFVLQAHESLWDCCTVSDLFIGAVADFSTSLSAIAHIRMKLRQALLHGSFSVRKNGKRLTA